MSSPMLRSPPATPQRETYSFSVTPVVKKYKGQQASKSQLLDEYLVQCASVASLKQVLWSRFKEHVTCLVELDTNTDGETTYRYKPDEVTEDHINHFIMLHRYKKYYAFQASVVDANVILMKQSHLQLFNDKDDEKPIQVVICKYSHVIQTATMFSSFESQVLIAQETDRAGAAAESAIQDMMARLRTSHEHHYQGHDIHWRLWAKHVVNRVPAHQQDRAVTSNPPDLIVEFFTRITSDHALHLRQLQVSANLTLDIITQEMHDVDDYIVTLEQQLSRARAQKLRLLAQRRLTSQFAIATVPEELDGARETLSNIPNLDDDEHSRILQ